jgi:hypothetical protein
LNYLPDYLTGLMRWNVVDDKKPWHRDAGLTPDRLLWIGQRLIEIRADSLRDHRPDKGDDAWVLGTVAYARTCYSLGEDSTSGRQPWLRASTQNHKLLLKIGSVPVYYYRGDPDRPRQDRYEKARQLPLGFPELPQEATDIVWMLVLETGDDGYAKRVVIQQVDQDLTVLNKYVILEVPPATGIPFVAKGGRDIPPAPLRSRRTKKKDKDADGENG